MARPRKVGLDFFPHSVDAANDEKIEAMCAVYGNDGYAFYFKLLERIYKNGGVLDVQNPAKMAAISRSITADSQLFDQMLQTAFELCLFDRGRFEEEKVLTSAGIERRIGYVAQERARKRAWKATSDSQEVLDVQNPAKTTEKPDKHKTINNKPPISPKRGNEYSALFLTFWEAYPKKQARKIAYKAFQKINPDVSLLNSMLETLERQKRSKDWQKEGGQYIPQPSAWLNGRRWEDETIGQEMDNDVDEYEDLP